MSKPICAIINPKSGGWRKRPVAEMAEGLEAAILRWLCADGRFSPDQIEVHLLTRPEESAILARQAVLAGCKTIVAAGGDGTINDVLQGMLTAESAIEGATESMENREYPNEISGSALGIIPMGTVNVLARILNVPVNAPEKAAAIITTGQTRRIDVGRAGTRWFALMAGIGFDAAVTQAVDLRLKRRIGEVAYVWAALTLALHYPRRRIRFALEDEPPQTHDAYLLLVANGGLYGGRFLLGAGVRMDDGWLDVYVCKRQGPLLFCALRHGIALLQNRFEQAAGVTRYRAQRVTIDPDEALCVQLDGEAAGSTPLRIEIAPNALRVCVPEDKAAANSRK